MRKTVKILAILLGIITAGLIILAIALPFIIDPNQYKDDIIQAVKEQTGRELTLEGDIGLSVFPWLGLELGAASLSNAPGFGDQPFARIETAAVKVELLPLLRKQVVVDTIVLDGLHLNLARNRQGETNWNDLAGPTAEAESAPGPPAEKPVEETAAISLADVRIGGLDVRNARLRWQDAGSGADYTLQQLTLTTGTIQTGAPVTLKLGFDLESSEPPLRTRVELDSQVAVDPEAQTLEVTNLTLQAAGAVIQAEVSGRRILDAPSFAGQLTLNPFSPRATLEKFGLALTTADPAALGNAALSARFQASETQVALQDLALTLDDSRLQGSLSANFASAPAYRFDLTLDQIDADRYLPPATEMETTKEETQEPLELPLDLLRTLNTDGVLRIQKLKAFGIHSSDIQLRLTAKDGVIKLGPNQAKLYQGQYQGRMRLDVRQGAPRLVIDESLSKVELGPLLKDAGVFDKLSGIGDVSAKLTARGLDVGDILNTLNGQAAFSLKNGKIKGVNLHKMVNDARDAYDKARGKPVRAKANITEEMEYAHLGGSVTIKNGVVHNRDLKMDAPFLDVTGRGSVNLPKQRVDYRLQVTISEDKSRPGTPVPVRIHGALMDPTFSIEWQKVLQKAVQREIDKKVKQEKERLRREIKKQLDNKLRQLFK